ncbi:ornithine cyclodeaminase family protein [Enterobacterales bacterium CwR94]|nr:ornithine cyclodeaminase family protein [Enterobacterales bacterium CwR94]
MRVIEEAQIKALYHPQDALEKVKAGFQAFSAGQIQLPPVQQFFFPEAGGDCCVKSAWIVGSDSFCVKISSGFYRNPEQGLPSNDGLNLLFSAQNGQPQVLLNDHGWLTAMRTALAGRIAAELLLPARVERLAIFGTGLQAELQLRQLLTLTACREVIVWGRSEQALTQFRQRLADTDAHLVTTENAQDAANSASIIVTATPSLVPLLQREWIMPGTHITAVGADAPGKQELAANILADAHCILVDSLAQCRQYGELSHVSTPSRDEQTRIEIGALLSDRTQYVRQAGDITVADLTGLGVQDAQISASILAQYEKGAA